mmetsp:Transcript_111015/g.313052  ORF Transcript_111015/g.313052 Transcript_111015/m.313052 type:complete len:528 (-) Transcript_111015:62-1645(-)
MAMPALALLVALFTGISRADDHIVLAPISNDTTLPEKMFVFIPGGKVPNAHYVATAASIQASAVGMRLWVTIPTVFQNLCIISCSTSSVCFPLHSTVEDALSLATQKGWQRGSDDSKDMWLAGHSLGGVCANTLFQAYATSTSLPYAAVIVMGSYVDESGDHDLTHYPVPLLTLNVELDGGLGRPGKTATWWRQYRDLKETMEEQQALTQKAVIILPGLNHSDFCPGFDVPGDLPAEVSQDEATKTIGKTLAAFLHMQLGDAAPHSLRTSALGLLREAVAWTEGFITPYLKAQDMERLATDTTTSAEGSSSFCADAQHVVAGLSTADDARLQVLDGFHVSSSNLEHCHPNYTAADGGGLLVHSCSHADYYSDLANTGEITAASEIACKMLSSDRVAEQLKTTAADPNVPCSAGNQKAVAIAEALAPQRTLERFKRIGRGWCFEDDRPTLANVGPVWVFYDALKLEDNATCMAVSSPVLKTEIDGYVYPGNHYCKFLSPARVLDWMMTDSLKQTASFTTRVGENSFVI